MASKPNALGVVYTSCFLAIPEGVVKIGGGGGQVKLYPTKGGSDKV